MEGHLITEKKILNYPDNHLLLSALQLITDGKNYPMWIVGRDGNIIIHNKAFEESWIGKIPGLDSNRLPDELKKGNEEAFQNGLYSGLFDIGGKAYDVEKKAINEKDDFLGLLCHGKEREGSTIRFSKSAYLKALLDNIPFQIYFKDTSSRFTLINKAQMTILGLKDAKEAIGKSDFDFFTEEHSNIALKDELKIMQTGIPIVLKPERIRKQDGSYVWMSTTKAAIKGKNGESYGIVGISYDVSEKIETENQLKIAKEKAEESDRLKTAFLANMSHEIRTPMNGIIGFINLLKEPDITEEEKIEFFDHIESCSRTLLTLIDDIIDVSKIESGQLNIVKSEINIDELVIDLVKTFEESRKSAFETPVDLRLNIAISENYTEIYSDPYRIRQVLNNLLNNAFKFTQKGFIEIGYSKDENYIKFYVKDTGIGIPNNKRDIIFERFGQANQNIYLSNKGTGLGLSISKNLIEMLGGEIWFESVENAGTTFCFTLPLNNRT